jgi:hypothetical protein
MRLFIFLGKIISLTYPCSPIMPRGLIWWPMMSLAALELSIGGRLGWGGIGLLAVVHTIALVGIFKVGNGLCGAQGFERWRYDNE